MSPNRPNDDLDVLADRLRGLPELPVPAGLEARLLAAIPDGGALAPPPRRHRGNLLWLGGTVAAAAVVLAFLLGYLLGKRDGAPDNPHAPLPPTPPVALQQTLIPGERVHADLAPIPSSFDWPVTVTMHVTAHRLPDDLTD